MNKTTILKNIALILFGIVVVLLLINIIVTKYVEKDEQPKNRDVLSGNEIDKIFHTALSNYGFSANWVIKKKLLWENDVEMDAEELSNPKRTLVKFISDKKLKVAAELIYNDKIKREFGTVAFLVNDLPLKNEEVLSTFLNTPELFYVVLTPKDEAKKRLLQLSKANKRYALLLDDNITELNYKLSGSYSDDKIKKSIKEIVGTFYSAAFFIIDDRSDLFESEKYPLIKSELLKRGIVLVPKSRFEFLTSSKISAEDKFQDFMLTVNKSDEKILMVNAQDFLTITSIIPAYRKIGYKFIYPGDIIIKRNL